MRREVAQVTCRAGHQFGAEVYRSANVTRAPELRDEIVAGSFNMVRCPVCNVAGYANVPFLYHDMDSSLRVWVYPEEDRSEQGAILRKIRRAASIASTVLPTDRSGPQLVFGLDELKELICRP